MTTKESYLHLLDKLHYVTDFLQTTMDELNELIGECDAGDELAAYRRSKFTITQSREFWQRGGTLAPMGDVEERDALLQNEKKSSTSTVEFTKKEISQMTETFKRAFIANGLAAHVHKRPSGKRTFLYEIRYRANGYCIIASSTDLVEAKKKFIAKTMPGEIEKYRTDKVANGFSRLEEIFEEWCEFKRGSVLEKERQRFRSDFESLPSKLKKMHVEEIRTVDISRVMRELPPRKYEQMRTIFNGVFKYAIASGVISNNPVALIPFRRAERVSRESLTTEEVYSFLEGLRSPTYDCIRQGAYLLYFFGLRPCEVDEDTRREGEFLITRNRKRKNGKVEYKKIPIPKQAQGLIDWEKPLTFDCSRHIQNKLFKELLGNGEKTAYCLRHTFCTLCQEAVRQEIVEIWMGDSPERLIGKVYTHFSDKFMRSQMDLVTFPTLENR